MTGTQMRLFTTKPSQLGRAVNDRDSRQSGKISSHYPYPGTIIGRNKSRTVIDFHQSYRDKGECSGHGRGAI